MSSFPVLRTRLPVCFLLPFPDSLPQLFLRCLPCALAFGLFPFPSAFFRPLLFRFRLLSLCFFLSSFFPSPPHSGFLGAPFHFRFFGFPRSFRPGFPCLLSRFFVLGFLFVSFHPSRFRSHSCSTGASLLVRFRFSSGLSACFPDSFVPFSLLLTTQPSALSFPFFPFSPVGGSFGACRFLSSPTFSPSLRPVSMPSFRFWYSAYCASFLRSLFHLTVATSAPGLLFPARPFPFAFALGSGYSVCPFRTFRFASDLAYITTQ